MRYQRYYQEPNLQVLVVYVGKNIFHVTHPTVDLVHSILADFYNDTDIPRETLDAIKRVPRAFGRLSLTTAKRVAASRSRQVERWRFERWLAPGRSTSRWGQSRQVGRVVVLGWAELECISSWRKCARVGCDLLQRRALLERRNPLPKAQRQPGVAVWGTYYSCREAGRCIREDSNCPDPNNMICGR